MAKNKLDVMPLRVIRKREEEYLPILKDLRRKHPSLADYELLAYMFLMLKDKTKDEERIQRDATDAAYAFDRGRQRR